MPWLVKDKENPQNNLLFVHVPRCGGTSLTKHFHVEQKSIAETNNWYLKFGLLYFFYRYRQLEKTNFPLLTWENLYAATIVIVATIVWLTTPDWEINACDGSRFCPAPLSISFWVMGTFTFVLSSFIMVACVMARVDVIRQAIMWGASKLLCGFGSTKEYLHGVCIEGYLMHFTAAKMLKYEFVKEDDLKDSFAIVRNPFSRMVSIFGYNRQGKCESFDHFVREWAGKVKHYRETSTEEWDVYCHVIPMYEFCFRDGEQLVPHIIRQEDLKILTKEGGSTTDLYATHYSELPDKILQALRDMPHTNRRKTAKPWYEFYTQETFDLVYDMYADDFERFAYDTVIPNRPDLVPKKLNTAMSFRSSLQHIVDLEKGVDMPRDTSGAERSLNDIDELTICEHVSVSTDADDSMFRMQTDIVNGMEKNDEDASAAKPESGVSTTSTDVTDSAPVADTDSIGNDSQGIEQSQEMSNDATGPEQTRAATGGVGDATTAALDKEKQKDNGDAQ